MTEEKYQEKMKRKLDQSLLSRNLAFGNRARSFLNVYQQQAEYESRLKTKRTKREMEKYNLKLRAVRRSVEEHSGEGLLDEDVMGHERMFYNVVAHNRNLDDHKNPGVVGHTEIPKSDTT